MSLKMYPVLQSILELSGTFYLFAGCMTVSLPLVYYLLPETKDLGLEMIQVSEGRRKERTKERREQKFDLNRQSFPQNYFTPVKTVFYVDFAEYEDREETLKLNGKIGHNDEEEEAVDMTTRL